MKQNENQDAEDQDHSTGNPNEEKNTQIIIQKRREKNLKRQAPWWLGATKDGRKSLLQKIQIVMQSDFLLPENRLETLVQQAMSFQIDNCRFHNLAQNHMSLMRDHVCPS